MRAARVALVVLLSLPLAGCATQIATVSCGTGAAFAAKASSPHGPLEVQLLVCDPRGFFGTGTEVAFQVTPHPDDASRVVAGIALPEGVRWIGREPSFDGPMRGAEVLRGRVVANQPGAYVLRGWAELPAWAINGSRAAPADLVGVRGSAAAAEIYRPTCSRDNPDMCADASHLAVRIETGADLHRVIATIHADRNLTAQAMLWTGAAFTEGWRTWDLHLSPREDGTLRATVEFPEAWLRGEYGGTYQVWAYVYPDPAVDGRVVGAGLDYSVVNDQLRVTPVPG